MVNNNYDLARAAHYSSKEHSHQTKAWKFLQSKVSEKVLGEFFRLFRDAPKNSEPIQEGLSTSDVKVAKILKRLLKLNIRLDKPPSGYKSYVLGIEGVNSDLKPNSDDIDLWNDVAGVLKVYSNGDVKLSNLYPATTEPGRHYTVNPMRREGAAYVEADKIHEDIWQVGSHRDQPNCLVQTGNAITVVRDGNKDGLRGSKELRQTGYFGINFHHAKDRFRGNSIGKWSAGCLVVPSVKNHQQLMSEIKPGMAGSKVSYILLKGNLL